MLFSDDLLIKDAPFSESFKEAVSERGYETLRQLLSTPVEQLVREGWFTTSMMEELYAIFTKMA